MDQDTAQAELDRRDFKLAASGDRGAFAAIYLRYVGQVYTLCLRLARDRHHAEDLAQETFLRALRAAHTFRLDAPLGPWLKRIAANLAIDWQRTRWPMAQLDDEDTVTPSNVIDAHAALDLQTLLSRLPLHARTVLWLSLVEGWTHAELAERFCRSESWSKSIQSRALKLLRGNP